MKKAEELQDQLGEPIIQENHELIKREQLDSILELVSTEKGHFVAIGQYRLSDFMESKEMAKDFVKDTGFLINLVLLLINKQLQK